MWNPTPIKGNFLTLSNNSLCFVLGVLQSPTVNQSVKLNKAVALVVAIVIFSLQWVCVCRYIFHNGDIYQIYSWQGQHWRALRIEISGILKFILHWEQF